MNINLKNKPMRNYKKHRPFVIGLFKLYLTGEVDKKYLYNTLTAIENQIKQNKPTLKSLWFKFFEGDTGATTLQNIYNRMENPSDDKYYKECMQIAIDNPKELRVYYS